MNGIKIGLATIVVAGIVFFVIRSFVIIPSVPSLTNSSNPFREKIIKEIKTLQEKPENKFCKEYYAEVAYHINDYYNQGLFGKNKMENDQTNENLSKQLYAAYADKFIKQSYYVFSNAGWDIRDLNIIRNECRLLQSSKMLMVNSPINRKFIEIKDILFKHDEITDFINTCKRFVFTDTDLGVEFPISDVKSKLMLAEKYQDEGFGNSYLNNCARLNNEIKSIPQELFQSYVDYLDTIIEFWSNNYRSYSVQRLYTEQLYSPVLAKIQKFGKEFNDIPNRDFEYNRLRKRWVDDATNAYNYLSSKPK